MTEKRELSWWMFALASFLVVFIALTKVVPGKKNGDSEPGEKFEKGMSQGKPPFFTSHVAGLTRKGGLSS